MSDRKSGKPSFFGSIKQRLIDDLLAASQKRQDGKGGVDSARLREDQLETLKKYDAQLESAEGIVSDLKTDTSAVQAFAKVGPRSLSKLLVSPDPIPFEQLTDLDAKFGRLPKGYGYRYLAPPTQAVPSCDSNRADNVVRLPRSFNLVIDGQLALFGDEIPGDCLGDWLAQQPAEMYRLWSLRILSLFGVLKKSELPAPVKRATSSAPSTGMQRPIERVIPPTDPDVAKIVQDFAESATMQYDAEVRDSETEAKGGVLDKRSDFERLLELGPQACLALGSLFDHPDVGVRVSAATYLLPQAPNLALPVLQRVASSWPTEDDRVERAAFHAQQTIWMYEDGNLKIPVAAQTRT